ncbi:4-(cytidine 5'-diphospho)-2-C-methyl-D-erythritol kinase [Granulibacter bethesdensis]|uniref:4-diphosphocytidyl-2-C-methyl-D-erythritol kinase n=1 Tax=Granulibacter bethesdensis (strain ATCC BAA-1260 / CGDNIH1) TaxID=391165 RepID=ISPE_GRABC|nr:4-(cytidine 5'-diphospho)-2-C-methyl-D-erythritol kinase [Granulibacter bethesdensis]Q0BR06.1 RecName: Full=4-diphosphocytidyl-2-C-methyl-D-erythritol kinase; Short=CMK; AltName: Full=4-(cytidine-5'-diphospho)-2-C-methyl-D-erythritol kinase [Granulibacter bethesdensis CGDNIH1]ABI62746.1 4-diphosphocytidyl-2-C-methyl-D-erythritol kinase [Granulibacter bethesdensis CGDNIH1]APH52606.1 4-diphosphocytidyl-2-C-methyl-D-erythritol kinase [Granulibacter bethesdensis]APH65295.1 4-diphosphocytidyl-2-C
MIVDQNVAFAPAKINLYLHVTGRRSDGYHLLDSLAVFAEACDVLRYRDGDQAAGLGLQLEGPGAETLRAEPDNLVLRAGRALAALAGIKPRGTIMLDKRLPVASGIGGGSSDAAAALRLLSRVWGVSPAAEDLHRIATSLGADVPVCLEPGTYRMRGIGERLEALPAMPEIGLLLANPGVPVSTPEVFRNREHGFTPEATLASRWPDMAALLRDLQLSRNDLQPPAMRLCPAIGILLHALEGLPGARLTRMSGSGATCFTLFDHPDAARDAAQLLQAQSGMGGWCWGGGLYKTASALDKTTL